MNYSVTMHPDRRATKGLRRRCHYLGSHSKPMQQRAIYGYRVVLERCRTFYPDCYLSFCLAVVPKREVA
jgi:hypothetical protein